MGTKYHKKFKGSKRLRPMNTCPLSEELHRNIAHLKQELGESSDVVIRFIKNKDHSFVLGIVHIDGISNTQHINQYIIEPLSKCLISSNSIFSFQDVHEKLEPLLSVSGLQVGQRFDELLTAVLTGGTAIVIDGCTEVLIANTVDFQSRTVSEPSTQTVIRGPKDSFTENLRTNTSLVRSRIQSPSLRLKAITIGEITNTTVEMMYVEGVADESIVREIWQRLNQIEIDGVLESGYIEQFIQDDQKTIFPTLLNTERPDVVAGNLLEGRVAIFVHGTPYVLIAPATFVQFFQVSEDYYENQYIGTILRMLRFGAFFLSLFAPAFYIAVMTHHQGLIPTVLLVSLSAQREGVPFPAIVEALIMEMTFEVLREAGIRMPRAVGQALSIVGALILGQAAVQAGFVSAAMVIMVSLTGIANFAIPNYSFAIAARILRFALLLIASFIGLYGILLSSLCIALHLCSLRTFGVPYFAPIAPFRLSEQKDVVFHFSLKSLRKRPSPAKAGNKIRIKNRDGD